jgi:hypothetical protein
MPIKINRKTNITYFSDLDIQNKKKESENVKLYNGKYANIDDCIYIRTLGYFLKTDSCIKKDYFDGFYHEKEISILVPIITKIFPKIEFEYTRNGYSLHQLPIINIEDRSYYLSEKLLLDINFLNEFGEDLYDGRFKNKKIIKKFKKNNKIKGIKFSKSCFNFLDNLSMIKSPITHFKTLGKKYKFGIEIETSSGVIPVYISNDLECSAVHDGSLRHEDGNVYGLEYVTSILEGDLGLKELKKICLELDKRCVVDKTCGNHVHLSDVNFSKFNIILMYWLYENIQNEIFSILPYTRSKGNEYCRKLPNLKLDLDVINKLDSYTENLYYGEIIKFLSSINLTPSKSINKTKNHPKGNKCGYDHSTARYCWVNFIPAVFNTRDDKSYTIEFRPFNGTTCYTDIKNWLLVCMALVDIVENHKQWLFTFNNKDKIQINSILERVYGTKGLELIIWFNDRKNRFDNPELTVEQSLLIEQQEYEKIELNTDLSIKNL